MIDILGLQLLIPVALLWWQWRSRAPTRGECVVRAAAVLGYLIAIALAGLWLLLPWWTPFVYLLVAGGLTWTHCRRPLSEARRTVSHRWRSLRLGFTMVLALTTLALSVYALIGRKAPAGEAIDVMFPVGAGRYLVVNGGSHALVNAHVVTLGRDPRYRPWRGQSYGVDLVAVNTWGLRVSGWLPADPARYRIFGAPLLAPCPGRVVSVANDRPDMAVPTPDPDRSRLAGNHVMIDCGGVEILLAHLRRGSVRVTEGQDVRQGQVLGLIGNSGNTSEPHLHVSAQRRAAGDPLIGGVPVVIRFDGDYLVRNEQVIIQSETAE